jgi:hypothetical protein
MKSETYRAACEQARAELKDIMVEFESLRTRKEQIERMIAVLEPLSGPECGVSSLLAHEIEMQSVAVPVAEEIHELVHAGAEEAATAQQPAETYVPMFTLVESKPKANEWAQSEEMPGLDQSGDQEEPEPVFKAEEVSADPIKRRIANALRHRAVLRDSREFNQAFSGSITRW